MKVLLSMLLIFSLYYSVNGQNWEPVSTGLERYPNVLFSDGDTLWAGNSPVSASVTSFNYWDGTEWSGFENWCPGGSVFDIIKYDGKLTAAGGCGVMAWNGSEWQHVGEPANRGARGLSVINNDLIAVGTFDTIGGVAAHGVARWDGQSWHAFDSTRWSSGPNITTAIEFQGDIYIGGSMLNSALGIDAMARWDGSQWHPLQGPFFGHHSVDAMAVYEGSLYLGGTFWEHEFNPMIGNHLSRWSGTAWQELGGGLGDGNDWVNDLLVYEDELYVVGVFNDAGGIPADRIAKWDGEEWCGFGDTFNNSLTAIEEHQGELYIGGAFTSINDDTIYRVAKWVGDDFVDQCGTLSSVEGIEANGSGLNIYPNPTSSTTTITWKGQTHGNYQLQLFDAQGRQIVPPVTSKTSGEWEVDMRGLAPGIYFGRLVVGDPSTSSGQGFKVVRE